MSINYHIPSLPSTHPPTYPPFPPSLPPSLTLVSLVFDEPANELLPHEAVLVVDEVVGVGADESTTVSDLTHQSS